MRMSVRTVVTGLFVLLLTIGASLVAGCGSDGRVSNAPTDPKAWLDKATERMDRVSSLHFELTHENGGTPIGLGMELTRAVGDVAKPDKLSTQIEAKLSKVLIKVQVITVGGETAMTNPLSGQWERIGSDFQALSIFNPNTGIKHLLESIASATLVGFEDIDGKRCAHLKGVTDAKELQPFTIVYLEGAIVDSELWIDEGGLVRQVKLSGRITESDAENISRTIKLTRFDEPVEIVLPK